MDGQVIENTVNECPVPIPQVRKTEADGQSDTENNEEEQEE